MDLNLNAGYLDKASLKSQRYLGSFRYKPSQATSAAAKYEYVGSTLKQYDTKNDWWRYSAQVGREFWKFSPEILYEGEKRKNRTTDHLTGFEFDDIGGRIGLINLKFFMKLLFSIQRKFPIVTKANNIERYNILLFIYFFYTADCYFCSH